MSPEQEPSNATLLAKMEGLDTFMREGLQPQIVDLKKQVDRLPERMAVAESRLDAQDKEMAAMKNDKESFRNRVGTHIATASASLVGTGLIVIGVLGLVHA